MHWGHAVSKDLVSWTHKGIALFPTQYEDQNGCFSGSAIEYEERMYLFYTGVHYNQPDPDNIHYCLDEQMESSQIMISSEDGMTFDNFDAKNIVIPPIEDKKIGDKVHTRDPKVWRGRQAWYMVLGSNTEEKKGELLFYKSTDLYHWSFVNTASKDGYGWMWECPDYFEIEGEKILIFSPMGFLKDGKKQEDHAICTLVEFEEDSCTMEISDEFQFLDYGLDLYAPQSTVDEEGRRVLVAWLRMPVPADGRWSGMFCIPRVVEVKNGHIYFRPHPNVDKMFTKEIKAVEEAGCFDYKVSLDLEEEEMLNIGGYTIIRKENQIFTDRTDVYKGQEDDRTKFATPEIKDGFHLDIYVDPNLIEIFINQGEYVISNVVYGLKQEIYMDSMEKLHLYTVE